MNTFQDPFYQYPSGPGASTANAQPLSTPAPQFSVVSQLNEQSLQAIREIVRAEVRKALFEDDGVVVMTREEFEQVMEKARQS